jgi:ABC-type bacteriocin/lantibiotic exporter with double-glycine peptidase domain
MISRMNDILKIQTVINYTLNNLVIDIFIYITMLLFIFTLVPWLAFIFVAFSIFFFLIAFFQTKKVTKAQKKVIESYGLNE